MRKGVPLPPSSSAVCGTASIAAPSLRAGSCSGQPSTQPSFVSGKKVLAAGQPGRADGRRGVQQRLHRLQRAGQAVFHDAHARAVAAALAKLVTDPEDRPVKRPQQLAELELPLEVAVERGDLLLRDRQSCSDPRQDEIEDRRLRVHDAAGQTHYRLAVFVVSQQEHGPGQDRCAVGHDPRAAPGDRAGVLSSGSTLMPPVQRIMSTGFFRISSIAAASTSVPRPTWRRGWRGSRGRARRASPPASRRAERDRCLRS
mgnify:CR=1 FL=1